MSSLAGPGRATRALAGACVLLAVVLAIELLLPAREPVPAGDATVGTLPEVGQLPAFVPPAFETFAEVLERPLFYEDRRLPPPPADEPVEEAPREPLQLVLEGIAISGDSRVALLRDQRSNEPVQIAVGAAHDGWTLESVDSGMALFRRGNDTTELSIEVSPDRDTRSRRRPR